MPTPALPARSWIAERVLVSTTVCPLVQVPPVRLTVMFKVPEPLIPERVGWGEHVLLDTVKFPATAVTASLKVRTMVPGIV